MTDPGAAGGGGAGSPKTPSLPTLEDPLGPIPDTLAEEETREDVNLEVLGRSARILGPRGGPLRVTAGRAAATVTTAGPDASPTAIHGPVGVERRWPAVAGEPVERWLVAKDAPVAWLEWQSGTEGAVTVELSLSLGGAPLVWRRLPAGVAIGSEVGADAEAIVLFSGPVEALELRLYPEGPDGGGGGAGDGGRALRIRATVRLGPTGAATARGAGFGARMALVAAGPGSLERNLRIAGRTRIAVNARAGAADRALQRGVRLTSSDPALERAFRRARTRLAFVASERVADRLAAGDFDGARTALQALAVDPPAEGFGVLLGRYLAWTGDLGATEALWIDAGRPEPSGAGAGASALRQVLEELGQAAGGRASDDWWDAAPTAAGPIGRVVDGLLGARPDAARGRLLLRPRPGGLERFHVEGLEVGPAALGVRYERDDRSARVIVSPERGGAPLQIVLAPRLDRPVAAARVDGEPADLEIARVPGEHGAPSWEVPVQLVLDRARTLEVEFEDEAR